MYISIFFNVYVLRIIFIITNGKNGLLIKPKDQESLYLAMEKILLDLKFRKSLAKPARVNIIRNYRRDKFLKEILALYSNLKKQHFKH